MKEIRFALNKQLSQLESESALINAAIQEIHRRFNLLDDVEAWGLLSDDDQVSPAFVSSVTEVVEEEEELDKVDAEREEDFEFAVSGDLAAE